jgi:large subunit ribosomal protein L35
MPKLKSNRGACKRFRVTANGKIKRSRAFMNHILTKKTAKRKRKLAQSATVDKTNEKNVRRMILM